MKKLGIIISIVAILAVAGCASSGGGSSSGGGDGDFYIVDLSTVKVVALVNDVIGQPTGGTVKNLTPFTKQYDDLLIVFPEFPVDVKKFSRMTVRGKYYDANGEEIAAGDGNAMLSILEDATVTDSKLIRGGAAEGAYPNIPFKQYNFMGFSGTIHSNKGARIRFSKGPGGILFQSSNTTVKFIELTDVIFHNSEAPAPGTPNPTAAASAPAANTATASAPVANTATASAAAVAPAAGTSVSGKPRIAVYVTSGSDRSLAARGLGALGAYKAVGEGLAKAIGGDKFEAVNLTDEIKKAYGDLVSSAEANAIGNQYGVQYLCIVTISNVKGKTFNLGVALVDGSNGQRIASSSNVPINLSNPVGMATSFGKMALELTAGIAINAALN